MNSRDITDRKAARARTELLAYAMNSSSDYILLVDRERMAYIDANEAALAFHGVDRETCCIPPWEMVRIPGRANSSPRSTTVRLPWRPNRWSRS